MTILHRQLLEDAGLLRDPSRIRSETFDRIARIAAGLADAPTSTVTIVTETDQRWPGAVGLGPELQERRFTEIEYSYCRLVVEQGAPLVVEDAREHELTRGNPAIERYDAIAYLGVPLLAEDGSAIGALCVRDARARRWSDSQRIAVEDLARWAVSEIELRRRVDDLERAKRMREEMIATISHDLRNPLAVILGASVTIDEAWEQLDDAGRSTLIGMIRRQGSRMQRLVDDLHDLVRLDARSLDLRPEHVAVEALVGDATGSLADIDVEQHIEPGLVVTADRGRLEQVLVNLLSNAAKYGAAPFVVEASRIEDLARIRIVDHGEGVPEDVAEHLFERFSRSRQHVQSGTPGTGLGLSIASGITELMGGELTHERPPEGGAAFVVTLPLA